MIRSLTSFLVALLVVATASAASANPSVNVQVFRPSAHHDDLFTVMNTHIGEHLRWSASLMLDFGKNPLVFVDTDGTTSTRYEVLQNQLTADLMGSISLFERLSIGLAVPLFLVNSGDGSTFDSVTSEPASFALGDIRLSPKVGILMREDGADGFGLGAELGINIPSGNADAFVSDGFLLQPTVIADYKAGPVLASLNLGFRARFSDETLPFDVKVSHEFFWRVGASYDILPDQLAAIGELYGASADYSVANNTHVEGVIGGRYTLPDTGLSFTLGGGSGFTKGYGNTKFRVFLGAKFSPEVIVDQDEDGILDDFDQCPLEPEDKDSWEDEDGCPDKDNDQDGVLDASDKCPNDAEDKDGFQDEDGCPDTDNDGDGILDADDRCIDDAEDKDDYQDDDGCPDLDNDGDGIKDLDDKCPNEPEVKNGFEDEDGCPDETLAKVEKGKIIIKDKIYFDTGKATIKAESIPVVKAVHGILQSNPEITKVSIEGHTDDRGGANTNRKLSQARAESVRNWLIENGVGPERLSAVGYGEDRPAMEGKSKEAREMNRRVEFIILEPPQE
ncbi:MAG: hypothetical protein EP329_13070 [Deltaproteobacteria bacterium]|nr:MAG: hypothetical protein EP329_13070 [Deltaproteobacteria bacterium]